MVGADRGIKTAATAATPDEVADLKLKADRYPPKTSRTLASAQ